ncbi:hypothetical protein [Legionella clemsonensis]|uniref:hypothetical protein n=1 Tax=Legionella clemsonensis TaxID=1867846 RepID=UPI0038B9A837
MLLNCNWPIGIKSATGFLLLLQCIRIFCKPTPHPQLQQLTCTNKTWLLYRYNHSAPLIYEKIRLIIDTGLFLLLELRATHEARLLVIFSDQIDDSTHRYLKLYEKFIQSSDTFS